MAGLSANSGMGSLCVTPCFVLTLQTPNKGLKARSFLFLAYVLCSCGLNPELCTLELFCCWECCRSTAELLGCIESVVLAKLACGASVTLGHLSVPQQSSQAKAKP